MKRALYIALATVMMLAVNASAQQEVNTVNENAPISNINMTDCGSAAQIVEVTIDPCPPYTDATMGRGCQLRRGTSVNFLLRFRPNENVERVKHEVFGRVFVYVRFHGLSSPDACPNIEEGCPLTAGNIATYRSIFNIRPNYPRLNVPVKYYIKEDGTNRVLVCFTMAAQIV